MKAYFATRTTPESHIAAIWSKVLSSGGVYFISLDSRVYAPIMRANNIGASVIVPEQSRVISVKLEEVRIRPIIAKGIGRIEYELRWGENRRELDKESLHSPID